MNLETRRTALARVALAPLALVAAAGATPVPVRLGASPNDLATPAFYAQSAGLFTDAGLDASIELVSNGTAVASAVAGNSIDVGLVSLFAVISAHARGVPLTLVAGNSVYDARAPQSVGVVVLADGPIHSPTDLEGKIVSAAALNDIMVANVRGWVDRNGGHSEQVQFVELTGPGIIAALDTKRIDAAAVVNPIMANLLATGKYRNLGDPSAGIGTHFLTTAWIAEADYAHKNAGVIRSFQSAMAKSAAYCNAHQADTAPLLAKFSGIDLAVIAHMARANYSVALDPRDIQPVIDSAAKYKIIPGAFPAREIIA
jgi:ABC-type nitrate/sulfonate/bicarbonate transport system substrate-binding protein